MSLCIFSFVETALQEDKTVARVTSSNDLGNMKSPGVLIQIAAGVDVALILLAVIAIDARCSPSCTAKDLLQMPLRLVC